jgi:hypothetical protein
MADRDQPRALVYRVEQLVSIYRDSVMAVNHLDFHICWEDRPQRVKIGGEVHIAYNNFITLHVAIVERAE